MLKTYKRKRLVSELQLVLTLLFVVALVVSNIITSKQVLLPFNITMTGAVFIFPITYILSDLVSEVYGYRWSRATSVSQRTSSQLLSLVPLSRARRRNTGKTKRRSKPC